MCPGCGRPAKGSRPARVVLTNCGHQAFCGPCLEAWAVEGGASLGGVVCPLCRVVSLCWGEYGAAALRADAAWARGEDTDRADFECNCATVGCIADPLLNAWRDLEGAPPGVWRSWRCAVLPLLLGAVVAIVVAAVMAPEQGRF